MNSFMKAIKNTFSLIFDFINEIQELGCIDNSSLSFNFVTLNEDFAMISSYVKSLNKLLENLQELQNTTFQKSPIMNSSSNKGSEDEVVCSSYVPHEQNLQYSHSSSTEDSNEPYAKTVKYKGGINPYNDCQSASRENINASQFSKSEMSLFITEKETAKNYYPSLPSYQEGTLCSTSTLVAPFENLALQIPINSGQSLGESVETSPYNSSSLNSDNAKSQTGTSYSLSNLQTFKLTFKSNICKNSIDESKNFKKCNYQGRDVSFSDKEGSNTPSSKNKGGGRIRKKAGASFVCTVCGRNFKTQKHLSLHLKKLHDDGENSIFTNDVDMENGEKISLPVYCCRTCHLASSNLTNFKNHFCKTSNEDTNQVSNKVLITSMRKIQQLRKFICDTCGVEFRALKRIIYHLPRCIPGPYQCNICSILFVSLKDLNYHKKKDHKDEKCFSCDECGKSFLRKASLRKHCINRHELLESMESKKPSSFKCDVCSKNFIKKIFLTNHKIRMHGLEKKFLCQVCGKKFMSNNSLMIHIDIHKGEKKFICQYCNKKFQRKEKLLHHERMHTGERPFKCNRCDKAFVSKARLNEHVRRHEADKRFECSQCEKTYASSWDLKKHMLKKHGLQISTQYVKVSLKKKNEKLETQEQIYDETQSTEQIQNLQQVLTIDASSDSINIGSIHSTQQCQMHHVQVDQGTISVPETIPVIIHPTSTSVNLVSFDENLEGQCVQTVENHLNTQPSLIGSTINLQQMRNPQIIFSASSNSQLNYPNS